MDTQPVFSAWIDEHGFMVMKLAGSLGESNHGELLASIEAVKQLVAATHAASGNQLRVLFDLSDFTGTYHVGAMTAMIGMEKANRPHVQKTAVFGGSIAARLAAELTITMMNIPTIKMFSTKDQAVEWLQK